MEKNEEEDDETEERGARGARRRTGSSCPHRVPGRPCPPTPLGRASGGRQPQQTTTATCRSCRASPCRMSRRSSLHMAARLQSVRGRERTVAGTTRHGSETETATHSVIERTARYCCTDTDTGRRDVARCGESNPLVRLEPCLCMVLWQINSSYVAGVHTPAKPVCGRHVAGTVVS